MCLIAVAWQARPDMPLVMAANRDEFHDRPTSPLHWWEPDRHILGGRDLRAGGGWMAVDRHGRVAAVTNVRRMQAPDPDARSRGELVNGFLSRSLSADAFLDELAGDADRYAGFNLLLHDADGLRYASNADGFTSLRVEPGLHVLSNAQLDTPWPKARRLRAALRDALDPAGEIDAEALFEALADRRPAPEAELPDTGVGRELERMLSPPFICSPRYGTRASTLLSLDADGGVRVEERRFDAAGETIEARVEAFTLAPR